MRCENVPGIRVALQDVFLSDTPLPLRPEKTPLRELENRPTFPTAWAMRRTVRKMVEFYLQTTQILPPRRRNRPATGWQPPTTIGLSVIR